MMPLARDKNGKPIEKPDNPLEAALYAWQMTFMHMTEAANEAFQSGAKLAQMRDDDVAIAETPADVVYEIDKVRVLRYRPLTDVRKDVPPVLICYGLFGRQTMIDLQEDRSLVRNLLAQGEDVYLLDWG
ncbi:MAG: class III poly(R)-hydroxyalkanoic acid synthase subunit PhaC, partial [Pseudomonadota bacterium]